LVAADNFLKALRQLKRQERRAGRIVESLGLFDYIELNTYHLSRLYQTRPVRPSGSKENQLYNVVKNYINGAILTTKTELLFAIKIQFWGSGEILETFQIYGFFTSRVD